MRPCEYLKENAAFHDAVMALADNLQLRDLAARLQLPLIMAQVGDVLTPAVLKASVQEHRAVAQAILDRDPEAASARMRAHLERAAALALARRDWRRQGRAEPSSPSAGRLTACASSLRAAANLDCALRSPVVGRNAIPRPQRPRRRFDSDASARARSMWTIWLCIGVAAATFAFGVAGLYLQKLLPEPHTSDRSRDMIGAIVGLISLLLALVLGTLIGSAYGFYSTQKSEMETFASRALQLDLALAEFGPETAAARAREMKETLTTVRRMVWWRERQGDAAADFTVAAPLPHLRADGRICRLARSEDAGAEAIRRQPPQATRAAIEQTRLLISLQLASSVSWPLVVIVVSWALILFCGFGVLSRLNATTLAALAFGAFAVGSALFLILELSQPFTGVFRLPSAAYDQMLDSLSESLQGAYARWAGAFRSTRALVSLTPSEDR